MSEYYGSADEATEAIGLRILEIGAGRVDFIGGRQVWQPAIGSLALAPAEAYVGIDIGGRSSTDYQLFGEGLAGLEVLDTAMRNNWRTIKHAHPDKMIAFAQADARKTSTTMAPFADAVFDRIVLNNLLSGGVGDSDLRQLLPEADRLLTAEGEIVIHDDWMPPSHRLEGFRLRLEDIGLPVKEDARIVNLSARYDQAAYDNARQKYGFPDKGESTLDIATLWVLGKSAFREAATDVAEVEPPQARPNGILKLLRKFLHY